MIKEQARVPLARMHMAQPTAQAKFVEGNLFRHITVMALTSSVGLMAIFAVDLVNIIFISMLGQEEFTAAIGYAGAILFFTTSFGIGLAIAVSALVARAVGQQNLALAREKATSGLIIGIVFGVIFSAVVWVLLPQIVTLLGATGRTHELTVHFLRIVTPAQPFLMIGMIGGAILRSHGDAKRAMAATLLIPRMPRRLKDKMRRFYLPMQKRWASKNTSGSGESGKGANP